jgi:subtilisin family serine protease
MLLRVLDEDGYGTFEDIIDAIVDACSIDEIKIINLSLGGYVDYPSGDYDTFEDLIDWCVYDMGKIVVSAAGNEDNIISYFFDDPGTPYYDVVLFQQLYPAASQQQPRMRETLEHGSATMEHQH